MDCYMYLYIYHNKIYDHMKCQIDVFKTKGLKPSYVHSRLIVLLLKQLLPDFLRKNCLLIFFRLQTHLVQFPRSPLFSEKFHHLPPDDILPLVQEVLFLVTETQTIPEGRLVAAKSIVIPVYYKVLSYLYSKFPKVIKYVKNSNISIVFTSESIFQYFICFCFAVNFHQKYDPPYMILNNKRRLRVVKKTRMQ